jgi:hypothetical protein
MTHFLATQMPVPRRQSPAPISPALWVAAGAAAGVLVGIAIADRSTSARRLMKQAGELLPALSGLMKFVNANRGPALPVADEDDGLDWITDDYESDDAEFDDEDRHLDDEEELDGDYDGLDARVLAAYDADPLLATLPIEIDSPSTGTITLDGVVPSARLIAHAVTIARGTPGVERVEQRLTVRRPRRPSAGEASGR